MAYAEELKVYKSAYDLLLMTYTEMHTVPREVRYTLLERLRDELTEVLILVIRANATHDKIGLIIQARELIAKVKIRFRILSDMHCINEKKYARYAAAAVEVSKQLSGWQDYCAKHNTPKTSASVSIRNQQDQGLSESE